MGGERKRRRERRNKRRTRARRTSRTRGRGREEEERESERKAHETNNERKNRHEEKKNSGTGEIKRGGGPVPKKGEEGVESGTVSRARLASVAGDRRRAGRAEWRGTVLCRGSGRGGGSGGQRPGTGKRDQGTGFVTSWWRREGRAFRRGRWRRAGERRSEEPRRWRACWS